VVREKLTELGLDYICRNAPPGRSDKDKPLVALSGDTKVPFLVDPDAGAYLFGPQRIIAYLEERYSLRE
jgi:glutathione S-transferase